MSVKTKWIIDPIHTEIGFKVKHLMITNVKGFLKNLMPAFILPETIFMAPEIDFWINPASVDMGNPDRNVHLKSPDFFDFDQFHEISSAFIQNKV